MSTVSISEKLTKAAWATYAGAGPKKLLAWNADLGKAIESITSTDKCTDPKNRDRMPSDEHLLLYFEHAKLNKIGKTLSTKRKEDERRRRSLRPCPSTSWPSARWRA